MLLLFDNAEAVLWEVRRGDQTWTMCWLSSVAQATEGAACTETVNATEAHIYLDPELASG